MNANPEQSAVVPGESFIFVALPLYFLGTWESGLPLTSDRCLVMWTDESRMHQFLGQTKVGNGEYTEFNDAAYLTEVLQDVKTQGIREVVVDVTQDDQTIVSTLAIDEIIDVMQKCYLNRKRKRRKKRK